MDVGEIYSPPYLFDGDQLAPRPLIEDARSAVPYGAPFGVRVRDAARAVLVAPGATTHGADMNQRLIVLETLRTRYGVGIDVRSPAGPGAAPPGYYMLFVLDNQGTPSVARWVRVGADAPPPAVLPDPAPPRPVARALGRAGADRARGRPHRAARDARVHAPWSPADAPRRAERARSRRRRAAARSAPRQACAAEEAFSTDRDGHAPARRDAATGGRPRARRGRQPPHGRRARYKATRRSDGGSDPRRSTGRDLTAAPCAQLRRNQAAARRGVHRRRRGWRREAAEDRGRDGRVVIHSPRARSTAATASRRDARDPPARWRSPAITWAWPSAISGAERACPRARRPRPTPRSLAPARHLRRGAGAAQAPAGTSGCAPGERAARGSRGCGS